MYRHKHNSSQITLVDDDAADDDNDNNDDDDNMAGTGRGSSSVATMGSKPGSNLKSKSNSNSKWNSRSKSRSSKADTDAGAGAGADARAQTSLRPRPSRRFSANKQLQILRGLYRRLNQSSTSVGSIGGGVGGNGDDGDGARGTLGRGVDDHDKNAPTSASTAVSASASASAPRRSFDSSDMSGRTLVPSASVSTASITSIDERDADEALPEAIDILYENQSGIWWFYQPHFSTPGSTPAWMGKDFTKSNVDVKNADVPDPSWAWVWPVWYIDMSYDVDEAGWQYSLSFLARHRWHGNHPWYISFVRRRRWLRKRKQRRLIRGRFAALEPTQMFENASLCRSRSFSKFDDDDEDDDDVETSDGSQFTTTLSAITTSLKAFNTDREKEELLYDFLDSDSEELLDLPPLMPQILGSLMYERSKTRLLQHIGDIIHGIPANSDDVPLQEKRQALLKSLKMGCTICRPTEFWTDREERRHNLAAAGLLDELNRIAECA